MLAMDGDSDDFEEEYTVADLKKRPKSYKELSALTGVPMARLKKTGKEELLTLPVIHYNFDTSIFKPRSRDTKVDQPKSETNGWGVSDDDISEDEDDEGGSLSNGDESAPDLFGTLTGGTETTTANVDPLSDAFSAEAMALTPDVPVHVKPKKAPPKKQEVVVEEEEVVEDEEEETQPASKIDAKDEGAVASMKVNVAKKQTKFSAMEAATRAATTPPNLNAAVAKARKHDRERKEAAVSAADSTASAASGPNRIVAKVDEDLKKRVKAKERQVRKMLQHELVLVQARSKKLIQAKKKLDNLVTTVLLSFPC